MLTGVSFARGDEKQWPFDVYLNDQHIGTHRFTLKGTPSNLKIESVAHFDVRFLGLGLYHYDHEAEETWSQNCLIHLKAATNDNGADLRVLGQSSEQGFVLNVDGRTEMHPGCLMTFACWNPEMLKQHQLINPQNGQLTNVKIEKVGRETLSHEGQTLVTDHYRLLAPEFEIDLWYDQKGAWVALDSTLENRQKLRYRMEPSGRG